MRLADKVVLVTGAGRGIGRAIALRLAADGASIAVNDVEPAGLKETARELEASGAPVVAVCADVSDRSAVDGMMAKIVSDLGDLDVVVANAGIVQVKEVLSVTGDDLSELLRVNVHGVLNCLQAGAKVMIAAGHGGKILAASSIAGRQGFAYMSHYSITKFGIIGLVQAAAKELAHHGITVNAYCPGMVKTNMADLIDEGVGKILNLPKGAAVAEFSKMIALGRLEEPEDVAALVAFLASSDADYITGQAIAVDGGITF